MPSRFDKELELFKKNLSNALGGTIRKPIPAKLGRYEADGTKSVKVPVDKSGLPNIYYFHEAGGQTFSGMAILSDGIIPPDKIRFGTPIRIRQDVLTNEWEIIGLDGRFAAQYYKNIPQVNSDYYDYGNIGIGILTQTNPISGKAVVSAGSYRIDDEWKYTPSLTTIDFFTPPYDEFLPLFEGKKKFVLVMLNFDTMELEYSWGQEVSDISFSQALQLDANNGNNLIMPVPPTGRYFRIGYVSVSTNKSTLQRFVDIFPLQDFLGTGDSALNSIANIVTQNGNTVSYNGEVVTMTL